MVCFSLILCGCWNTSPKETSGHETGAKIAGRQDGSHIAVTIFQDWMGPSSLAKLVYNYNNVW